MDFSMWTSALPTVSSNDYIEECHGFNNQLSVGLEHCELIVDSGSQLLTELVTVKEQHTICECSDFMKRKSNASVENKNKLNKIYDLQL